MYLYIVLFCVRPVHTKDDNYKDIVFKIVLNIKE